MDKCNCYHTIETLHYNTSLCPHSYYKTIGVCWGTKEREECSCGGDETKCDFYPEKRAAAQVREVTKKFNTETWIEESDGGYPDGMPKSKYRHRLCEVENKTIEHVYPYCPYCGKKITHIKVLRDGFEQVKMEHFKKQGYTCEIIKQEF